MGHFEEKPGVWLTAPYSGNAANYLSQNPDVAADPYFSARPLEHWERYGKNEGRSWDIPEAPRIEQAHSSPAPAPVMGTAAPREQINPPANVNLPSLKLTDGTSVTNQLNKLQSLDSLTMQQANQQAKERGAASGEIHSSQQGGAAQRAVTDALMPLANVEAQRKTGEEMANWSAAVKAEMDRYDKEYTGYLAKLGIQSNEKLGMLAANTALSTAFMNNMTSLLNNPDLVLSPGVTDKISSIFGTSLANANTILDMEFSYA